MDRTDGSDCLLRNHHTCYSPCRRLPPHTTAHLYAHFTCHYRILQRTYHLPPPHTTRLLPACLPHTCHPTTLLRAFATTCTAAHTHLHRAHFTPHHHTARATPHLTRTARADAFSYYAHFPYTTPPPRAHPPFCTTRAHYAYYALRAFLFTHYILYHGTGTLPPSPFLPFLVRMLWFHVLVVCVTLVGQLSYEPVPLYALGGFNIVFL